MNRSEGWWHRLALAGVIASALLIVPSMALAATGWSAPANIDGTNSFESVSCPSASFCAAVDAASPANVLTYRGSSWSTTASIDGGNVVRAVSCASSSFCAAVDDNGDAMTYNGSSWSAPVDMDGTNILSAVSCPSASFCAAVDNGGNAVTYNGSSWSAPVSIYAGTGVFESVSCPSASFCIAALNTSYGDEAVTYNGSSWSISATDDPTVYPVQSVSCVSSSFCVAVDSGGNAVIYNGNGWSAPDKVDGGNDLTSVSCPSASFCAAVDYATGATGNALTYNGSAWTAPVQIDSASTLNSVSCPSTSVCVAVDGGGNALTYSGGASPPRIVPPIARLRAPMAPVERARPFLLDGSGTSAGTSPIVGYHWSIGGANVICDGQQPVLRTELPLSESAALASVGAASSVVQRVRVALTVIAADGQTSTASSTLEAAPLSGPYVALPRMPHYDPRPSYGCSSSAAFTPKPPIHYPGQICNTDVKFGLIDAWGCLFPATSSVPGPEEQRLVAFLDRSWHCGHPCVGPPVAQAEAESYYSYSPVKINGLLYTPVSGAAILLDPVDDLVISTDAELSVDVTGTGTGITIDSGQIFQTVESFDQSSYTVGTFNLPQALPQPLPQIGLGLTGQLTATFVSGYRTALQANLAFPGLTLAATPQPIGQANGNHFTFSFNSAFAPATASATLYTDNDSGLSVGDLALSVPIAYLGPLELDDLSFAYSSSDQPASPSWHCGAKERAGELCSSISKLRLPGGQGFGASVDLIDGQIQAVSFNTLPDLPLAPGVTLSNLGGGVAFNPFYLTLEGSVTAGGLLSGNLAGLIAFGSPSSPFTLTTNEVAPFGSSYALSALATTNPGGTTPAWTFSEPILAFGEGQSVSLPDPFGSIPIDGMYGVESLPGGAANPYMLFGGSINTAFPFGVTATFTGQADATAFNLQASGALEFDVPGFFKIDSPQATAVISSTGIAACVPGFGGAGWVAGTYVKILVPPFFKMVTVPDVVLLLGSCDLGPFTTQVPHSATAQVQHSADAGVAGIRTFSIPRGSRGEEVRLEGAGGAPSVRLTAPDGESLVVDQSSGLRQAGGLIGGRVASLDQTILAVTHPVPGVYTITLLPGSVAIAQLDTAVTLPPERISARVVGTGTHSVLRYSVAGRPGQQVVLVERGPATYRVLKTIDGGGQGALRFTPAPGPGGPREIVAQISLDGVPRPALTVARFTAPALPGLIIRQISARREGTRVEVSWSPVGGASRYLVLLRLSSGRERLLTLAGNRRTVRFNGVPRTDTVAVLVRAVGSLGESGAPRVVRLRAAARFDNGVYPLGSRIPGIGRGHRHRR